jgi:hypothetical protein
MSAVQQNGSAQSPVSADPAEQVDDTSGEIISPNLRALETIYFTAMLEEARLFDVVDRLVAMFSRGLPLGPGRAGAMLYRLWKGHHNRLTTGQRHNVYARAFGLFGGDADVLSNREFNDLWMSFVSIVGMYSAELQSLPPGERSVSPEEVLISGRALALNLSIHGHGLAWFAAQDFKPEIQQVTELLSDEELQSAFGAKDPGQVISNVAASELGARPNVRRAHTRATSGLIIIRWLANRRARLLRPRSANILRHEDIVEGRTAASQNKKPNVYPTDSDLVTACEQWLGVTGTQEAELREREAPMPQEEQVDPVV